MSQSSNKSEAPRIVVLDGPNMVYAAYNGAKLAEKRQGAVFTARNIKMLNGKPFLLRDGKSSGLDKALAELKGDEEENEAIDCSTGAISFMLRKIKQVLEFYEYNVKLYVAWDKPGSKDWVETINSAMMSNQGIAEGDEYKAGRSPMELALRAQIPVIEAMVEAMGAINIGGVRAEADHHMGGLMKAAATFGFKGTIVSQDKDLSQWISDDCEIIPAMGGAKIDKLVRRAEYVEKEFGVQPLQIPDLLALAGDTIDNIPGVPGVGKKTAANLINRFGNVENLIIEIEKMFKDHDGDGKKVAKEIGIRGFAERGVNALKECIGKLQYYKEMTRLDLVTGQCMQEHKEMAGMKADLEADVLSSFRSFGEINPEKWGTLINATGINPNFAPNPSKIAEAIERAKEATISRDFSSFKAYDDASERKI